MPVARGEPARLMLSKSNPVANIHPRPMTALPDNPPAEDLRRVCDANPELRELHAARIVLTGGAAFFGCRYIRRGAYAASR